MVLYRGSQGWDDDATVTVHDSGFPTRSDTNRAVQQQNMARSLKFQI